MKELLKSNKVFLVSILLGCLWVPFFISCSGTKSNVESSGQIVSDNNPNEDSELTLLMRKIYDEADSIKATIKVGTGTITQEFIDELELVHGATPSKPQLSNPTFSAFNELMILEAKSLQSDSLNIKEGFNKLVNRCIECHKTFCPGPIPRIKKLKI